MHADGPCPCCFIVPPYVLEHLARSGDADQRARALETIVASERLRGERSVLGGVRAAVPPGEKRRTIYDARHLSKLPGTLVRGEKDAPSSDRAVNEAYDGLGATFDFYLSVLARASIDGRGMRLDGTVHFRKRYDNAFWNGAQMVFGDGDGKIFGSFTGCLEVIGHELTHGVVQHEANLAYHDQPGALNESMADVFGSLVKQHALKQSVDQADWLIGKGLLLGKYADQALRSMKEPGTAYDNPLLGKDPQPRDMKGYVQTEDDEGGVHLNSGIPNRAFYLAAKGFGGHAWESAGRAWYAALTRGLRAESDFADAARATIAAAESLLGAKGKAVVAAAWQEVGVKPSAAAGAQVA
jgi:Zn-dependent metalloprotease